MAIWNKGVRKKEEGRAAAVQTRQGKRHPFYALDRYVPMAQGQNRLYRALREAVPIIDAAIYKLVRLTNGFQIRCEEPRLQRRMHDFLENVQVGAVGQGLHTFVDGHFEQLLTYGTAVSEVVMGESGQILALYNANLEDIELRQGKNPLRAEICVGSAGNFLPVPHPERIILSLLHPEPGQIHGQSLLRGLPFVSDILNKIYNSIGLNWERAGNIRFALTYKPQNDSLDQVYARERAEQIAREWAAAMQPGGQVRDFVTVGDVNIKVIGADNQVLESQVPVRQMLEQIVAKLGLPPFLLGLSWSSTERMSQQQADILTSELEAYRRILHPVIAKVCRTWILSQGCNSGFEIVWQDVNMQDEVESARAQLYFAQAAQLNGKIREVGDRD